jgi:epoxide hydrolase
MASVDYYSTWDTGNSKNQSTPPHTDGYGLVDTPAGLCAWNT